MTNQPTMHRRDAMRLAIAAAMTPALGVRALHAAAAEPIKVTHLPSPSSPLIALRFLVRAGAQDDPPGKEGLASLTASMLTQGGTKDLSYDQLLQALYPMAAGLSGGCEEEISVFGGVVHRDNLAAYTELATAMIVAPRFAQEDFERLRDETVDGIEKVLRGGNDEELGKATLQVTMYPPGHPYHHIEPGTVAALKTITLDDVKAFHGRYYTQARLHLGVAGGADADYVDGLKKAFGSLPAGDSDAPPKLPEPPMPQGLEVTIVQKPADSTAISLGFPIHVNRADDDFYALAVANSYLGEHRTFNGKLMQDLRGKRGLNYGDYSYVEDFIQEGGGTFPVPNNPHRQQAFTVWIRPVPHDKAVFALRAALWEVDRLVTDGMSEADFETTRAFLLNYSKLWVQTLPRRLGYEMEGAFYGRRSLVAELQERLPKLTAASVNAAVRKHLKSPGFVVAIVTEDAEALAGRLKSGEPSPLEYDTAGTPEDVLAEDKTIAAFPLGEVKVSIVPASSMFEA